jgi:hypothetical protein
MEKTKEESTGEEDGNNLLLATTIITPKRERERNKAIKRKLFLLLRFMSLMDTKNPFLLLLFFRT